MTQDRTPLRGARQGEQPWPLAHASTQVLHFVHVAGINLLWTASVRSIQDSVHNAVRLVLDARFDSMALPVIGAGSGRFDEAHAAGLILAALNELEPRVPRGFLVRLVRFGR